MKRRRFGCVLSVASIMLLVAWIVSGGVFSSFFRHNQFTRLPATPEGIDESLRRGDRIIAALDAYRAEHGAYPETIDALVPGYLAQIERPTVGDQLWDYRVDPKLGFMLTMPIGPFYQKYWRAGTDTAWKADM